VIWDGRSGTLIVANDRFATRPLYWTEAAGTVLFAAEIKALFAERRVSRALSSRGLGQLFTFGQFLGTESLFDGIRVLAPGQALTFSPGRGHADVTGYAPASEHPSARSEQEWVAAIDERLVAAVSLRTSHSTRLGLSLSGGLDARTLLALVDRKVELNTVSLGIPGSIDHRSAARLAQLSGHNHHEFSLDQAFLARFREHLIEMVRLTDGQYLDQGIVMTTLPRYRELGIRTLLRGHAGELMHMNKAYSYSLDAEALAIKTREALADWLQRQLSAYMVGALEGPLFTRQYQEASELARQSLADALASESLDGAPVRLVWPLFVHQRLARETALSMHKFRSFVEVRLPYLDEHLIPWLIAAPESLKLGDRLQTEILRRHMPAFLAVVNANTGAPMGAGSVRTRAAWLKMKVYSRLGVPGYQPYERLGLWLSRELRPMVHDLLFSERFNDRSVFEPQTVRTLVDEHEARRKNHTFLLMALMIFELGQRALVDDAA
jgi:asparagine synthetase B (glutamine-hydrolysing)